MKQQPVSLETNSLSIPLIWSLREAGLRGCQPLHLSLCQNPNHLLLLVPQPGQFTVRQMRSKHISGELVLEDVTDSSISEITFSLKFIPNKNKFSPPILRKIT